MKDVGPLETEGSLIVTISYRVLLTKFCYVNNLFLREITINLSVLKRILDTHWYFLFTLSMSPIFNIYERFVLNGIYFNFCLYSLLQTTHLLSTS